jgi:RimJ/RimL family protein N-acetyltransferase
VPGKALQWISFDALIGGSIRVKLIEQHFIEVLRLAASIQQGTVGYYAFAPHNGRGYMTTGLRAVVSRAFRQLRS